MNDLPEPGSHTVIDVRVIARAPRNEIQGLLGDTMKIRLQAPPVGGKANKALVKFLARRLHLPARSISILAGQTSRNKRVRIEGLSRQTVRKRLLG
jgi:uncharacterized protein (TIGR00251 family)